MSKADAGVRLGPVSGFGHITDWVFDLDNTLYPAECDLFAEIDIRMTQFVSEFLGLDKAEARKVQKSYYVKYGTTLSGLMRHDGLAPEKFLDYVHNINLEALPVLPGLNAVLKALPGRKLIYTNGSRQHARQVTEAMELAHLFDGNFGIEDSDYHPKPRQISYDTFCGLYKVNPKTAIFFEDLSRNLLPAKDMGFATVLVHSEKDWGHEPIEARPASLADVTGDDGAHHIDYVTGNLTAFLEAALESLTQ